MYSNILRGVYAKLKGNIGEWESWQREGMFTSRRWCTGLEGAMIHTHMAGGHGLWIWCQGLEESIGQTLRMLMTLRPVRIWTDIVLAFWGIHDHPSKILAKRLHDDRKKIVTRMYICSAFEYWFDKILWHISTRAGMCQHSNCRLKPDSSMPLVQNPPQNRIFGRGRIPIEKNRLKSWGRELCKDAKR